MEKTQKGVQDVKRPNHVLAVKMKQLLAQGVPFKEIAGRLGLTLHQAENVRWSSGLSTSKRQKPKTRYATPKILEMEKQGKGVREIAREVGLAPTTVSATILAHKQ